MHLRDFFLQNILQVPFFLFLFSFLLFLFPLPSFFLLFLFFLFLLFLLSQHPSTFFCKDNSHKGILDTKSSFVGFFLQKNWFPLLLLLPFFFLPFPSSSSSFNYSQFFGYKKNACRALFSVKNCSKGIALLFLLILQHESPSGFSWCYEKLNGLIFSKTCSISLYCFFFHLLNIFFHIYLPYVVFIVIVVFLLQQFSSLTTQMEENQLSLDMTIQAMQN